MEVNTENKNNGYHDQEAEEWYGNLIRGDTQAITTMGNQDRSSLLKFLITMPEEWKEYQILQSAKYADPEEAYLIANVMYAFKRAHFPLDWIIMQLAAGTGARGRNEDAMGTVSSFRYYTNQSSKKENAKTGDSKLGPVNG